MCLTCVEKYGGTDVEVTDDMRRVSRLVNDLYSLEGCVTGGPLHIVVDDYNLEAQDLEWCRKHLDGRDYEEHVKVLCHTILDALTPLTLAQRARAIHDR